MRCLDFCFLLSRQFVTAGLPTRLAVLDGMQVVFSDLDFLQRILGQRRSTPFAIDHN